MPWLSIGWALFKQGYHHLSHCHPVDAIIFVRPLVKLPDAYDPRLVRRLGHEAVDSRSHPDAAPALAGLFRLRLNPAGKPDSAAQVTDGAGVSRDRVVIVQRRGTLPATAYAGQIPAVSGPGRHQQRPAAEFVAEVAQDRQRHGGKPVDAVLRWAALQGWRNRGNRWGGGGAARRNLISWDGPRGTRYF